MHDLGCWASRLCKASLGAARELRTGPEAREENPLARFPLRTPGTSAHSWGYYRPTAWIICPSTPRGRLRLAWQPGAFPKLGERALPVQLEVPAARKGSQLPAGKAAAAPACNRDRTHKGGSCSGKRAAAALLWLHTLLLGRKLVASLSLKFCKVISRSVFLFLCPSLRAPVWHITTALLSGFLSRGDLRFRAVPL